MTRINFKNLPDVTLWFDHQHRSNGEPLKQWSIHISDVRIGLGDSINLTTRSLKYHKRRGQNLSNSPQLRRLATAVYGHGFRTNRGSRRGLDCHWNSGWLRSFQLEWSKMNNNSSNSKDSDQNLWQKQCDLTTRLCFHYLPLFGN